MKPLSIDEINNLQAENQKLKRQLQIAEYFIKCVAERKTNNIPHYKQAQTTLKIINEVIK